MKKVNFNWTANEEQDDFTCKVNGYCLRAECMASGVWWWCVYDPNGDQVDSSYISGEWSETADQAKQKAEEGYAALNVEQKVEA